MSDDYAASWLELEKNSGGRICLHGTPEEIKGMYDQMVANLAPLAPPKPQGVEVRNGDVDGIKYRVYIPSEAAKSGPLPVAIWTHGGGWMTGDLDSDDFLCHLVALQVPSVVVNIDYRLTPEFTYPTQLEDSLKVMKWAHQNAASINGDPNKFYTIGGSAGGALALQIANRVRKNPATRNNIRGVAAVVPCTTHWDAVPAEYKSLYKSYEENKSGVPLIDKESMEIFYKYVKVEPSNPDFFTALATDNHANFPPTYFVSCGKDPLRDDAYVMEAALKKAGVPTKHDHYKGMPHYFWNFPGIPEAQQYVANLVGGVKWLIGQM